MKKEDLERRIKVREQTRKLMKAKRYDETFSALDTKVTLTDFENKDKQQRILKRLRGGGYSFTTNKVYPLLNASLLSNVFSNTEERYIKTEKKLHLGSKQMNRDVLKEYKVPTNLFKYFREKDGKLFFAKIISLKEIEKVYEFILNNDNVKIPCLHSCEVCDYHTDNYSHLTLHLKSKLCRETRGIPVVKKKKKIPKSYQCKECKTKVWRDKGMYNRHRDSDKCQIKRGLMSPKITKVFNCDLCYPIKKKKWTSTSYKRHRKGNKCLQRQREAGEIE